MNKTIFVILGLTTVLLADYSRDDINDVVTDTTTHLQWQDTSDVNVTQRPWIDSIDYCEALTLGGYEDWRLPNINELLSISDKYKTTAPAIDVEFKYVAYSPQDLGKYNTLYWSSTSSDELKSGETDERAYTVNFNYGDEFSYWGASGSSDEQTKKTTPNYVRCVREE